jgi:hypothetical protein
MAIQGEVVERNKGGRPLKFTSPKKFKESVDEYFAKCDSIRDLPTITGLAVHLDTNRQTLINYQQRDGFFDTIKRAQAICEAAIESRAMQGGLNATMAIFSLKNNYGWVDRQEQDITSGGDKLGADIDPGRLQQLVQARAERTDI